METHWNKVLHSANKRKAPFFIVGSVRSGTTMLRDLLRLHPNLECPEETHFFRWAHPYSTPHYLRPYERNPVLRNHRELDGVSEHEFQQLIERSASRRDLAENYGRLFLEKCGNPNGRWFDKSPQNVYGILLISSMFPEARFVHIHRNPLDVVASLFRGKIMKISSLKAAVNAWTESMCILCEFNRIYPQRLLEIPYAEVVRYPENRVNQVLTFVGEDPTLIKLPPQQSRQVRTHNRALLDERMRHEILIRCEPFLSAYGYAEGA